MIKNICINNIMPIYPYLKIFNMIFVTLTKAANEQAAIPIQIVEYQVSDVSEK